MNYLSVCSGIEAATVAWHPLGLEPVAFSEIEKFPSAVLAHHYPDIPNLGDMTKYKEWKIERTIDIIAGGTPCQSFSVAGLRKGLDDPRGNLALVFCGLIEKFRPRWVVLENVPGVLSSKQGRDFGSFIGALAELGYGWAYKILDAQYFGVPQRRRRVFVVGYFGDWRAAAAVLFECHSLSGNPPPSRKKGKRIAGTLEGGTRSGGGLGDLEFSGGIQVCGSLTKRYGHKAMGAPEVDAGLYIPVCYENHGQDSRVRECGDLSPQLNAKSGIGDLPLISHKLTSRHDSSEDGTGRGTPIISETLTSSWYKSGGSVAGNNAGKGMINPIIKNMSVRCLTPRECERLMGFNDDYTMIPWRGKPAEQCPDGPRYKALGNSIAVPVMRWLGERI